MGFMDETTEEQDDINTGDSNSGEEQDHPAMREVSIGAPDEFYQEIDRSSGGDSRVSEKRARTESKPNHDTGSTEIPLEKVGTTGVTRSHLHEHGITKSEAAFLRAVVKAMNRDLQGYNLTESMSEIRNHYEINEDKLIKAGYLKRHTGAHNRIYYTVTFDGQKACRLQKKQGLEIGDVGADTPHRVGIDLARQYYESLQHVRRVELAVRENGRKTDLLVVNNDGNRIAIIEVEGGRVNADPNVSEDQSTGINNYSSVRDDYRMLAASDGESVWVVRNYELVGDVLRALRSGDDVPFEIPKDVIKSVEQTDLKIGFLNEKYIATLQDDGITEIVTFKQLRNRLK